MKFGTGTVRGICGNKIDVLFDGHVGLKKGVIDTFLEYCEAEKVYSDFG